MTKWPRIDRSVVTLANSLGGFSETQRFGKRGYSSLNKF